MNKKIIGIGLCILSLKGWGSGRPEEEERSFRPCSSSLREEDRNKIEEIRDLLSKTLLPMSSSGAPAEKENSKVEDAVSIDALAPLSSFPLNEELTRPKSPEKYRTVTEKVDTLPSLEEIEEQMRKGLTIYQIYAGVRKVSAH